VTVGRSLSGVARTSVSFVIGWLSSGITMQPFYWVCRELGAIPSLLVYITSVCSGKVTLCVCVCICFYRKSEYFDYCYLQSSSSSSSSSSYGLQGFRPHDLFRSHYQSRSL
jgi:hypothetical protein